MSFETYAYVEHTLIMRKRPNQAFGVGCQFTGLDLLDLLKITEDQLLRHPLTSIDGVPSSEASVIEMLPSAERLRGKMLSPVLSTGAQTLIAVFSTLGQAAKAGREIDACFQGASASGAADVSRRQRGLILPEVFLRFESDIVNGAQQFFGAITDQLGMPLQVSMMAFTKPMTPGL